MANKQMADAEKPSHVSRTPPHFFLYSLLPTSYFLIPTLYLLISLITTWPLVTHLQGWVPGWGDWGQNMWALWWTRQALLSLAQSPFYTHYLFYPEGVTLLFHPLDVSDGLLAIPLYGLLGGDITYNLMILLSFVLGGWGTYLLALYLTHHRGASFVAGLVFALSPYHFLRIDLGHLNLSTVQWIPFFILFLLKYAQRGSKRSAALAIFFLVFTALNSWYYVIYCGLLALALIFWPTRRQFIHHSYPKGTSSLVTHHLLTRLARIAIVLVIAMLILSPLLIPMFRLLGATTLVGVHDPLRHSVDMLSFWVPGPPSTWAGWFEDVWISYAAQNREPGASAYLGYVALALSMVGLFERRRRRRWQAIWWLAVGLGFTVLALGPQLQIGGQLWGVSLPYQWLATLSPIFSITGIPGRFVVITSLALSILVAYGLVTIIGWLDGSHSSFVIRHSSLASNQQSADSDQHPAVSSHVSRITRQHEMLQSGVILIASLLIFLEYLAVPLRLTPTALPKIYTTLGADTESYAVLDIKWDANYLMHAQTVHGKPIIGGWLARLPESQAAYLEQDGLDKAFLHLLLGPDVADQIDLAAAQPAIQSALAERDVRYIINHSPAANDWLKRLVGWPVIFRGDGVVIYGKN